MTGRERSRLASPALWTGVFAGPVFWALAEVVNYTIVRWTCAQHQGIHQLITAIALIIIVAGAIRPWRLLHSTAGARTDGARVIDVERFIALYALASCAFFAIAIVAFSVPPWVIDGCR